MFNWSFTPPPVLKTAGSAGLARVRAGFTLVEVLVVVVIIGIASAMIVPQLGMRDDLRASTAARQITADLIYAQSMAITQQTPYYVQFSDQSYSIVTSPGGTPIIHPINAIPYVVQFSDGAKNALRDVQLASAAFVGQSSTTSYTTVGFDELGTPVVYNGTLPADTLTSGAIVVKSGNYQLEVDVVPFTGEIHVK